MAERSKAAVSKTVNGFFPFGGSNPPLSASFTHPLFFLSSSHVQKIIGSDRARAIQALFDTLRECPDAGKNKQT